ncbi:MAG TPA: hypothetical protein PLF21_05050 [Exilispira sp.]|nr:hypothetical protein [Exilispira sp.]
MNFSQKFKVIRPKIYYILFLFLIILILINIINISIIAQDIEGNEENDQTQQTESIYTYLSPEEAFFLITYSNLDELKKIATALGISFSENITIDQLRKLLYEYYNFKEVKKENTEDALYIKTTDIINISEEDRIIDLVGNNVIIYKGYMFKADRIVFYIDEEVFYGYGNVSFKSSSLEAVADNFEYSISKKNGTLHNATIYVDKYIISTNKANISDNGILTTEKAGVTQCNYENPHYYLRVNKVLYAESIIYFYEVELVIGNDELLYLPLYISYEKGSGYPLLFGMDYGYREGFMIFNTLPGKSYEIYFDLYERLGLYIGFKASFKWGKDSLNLLSGIAISPDLFYINDDNSWTVVPPNDTFSLYNINFRTGLYGNLRLNPFNFLSITFNFAYYSDPYFKYDYFIRERFLRIDIAQFTSFDWQDDYNLFPTSMSSYNEELIFNIKILKYNLNVSSALNFTATKSTLLDNSIISYYLYSPKYYQYYLSSVKWYSGTLGGNIINFSDNKISFNLYNSIFSNYYTYYNPDSEITKKSLMANASLNPSFNFKLDIFSYSMTMNNNISYSVAINENTTQTITETFVYYCTISNSLNLQIPFVRLTVNFSQSYRNSLFEPIDFGWLSNKATASIIFNPFDFISLSANLGYNFLDTTNNDLWVFSVENFDIVNLSGQLKFKYFVLNLNSKYYISVQKFLNNQFNFSINLPKTKIWFFWLTLSNGTSLKIDETNPFLSSFENNFNVAFSIENQLQILFRLTSYNQFIYRYNNIEEAFLDLLNSFNFFDYNAYLNSFFDLRSLSLSITRYLHDMTIQFQISGSFVLSSDKTQYNFVLSYSLYIISNFLTGYKYLNQWENIF